MTYYNEYSSPEREQNLLPVSVWNRLQEMSQGNLKRLEDNAK